jgi:hypothetical protein
VGGALSDQDLQSLEKFTTPFGAEVELLEVRFEGEVKMLRVRIRQGTRFTDLDLDPVTAKQWADRMTAWSGDVL